MKQAFLKSLCILSVTFLLSCGDDDSAPLGAYENGVFVVNEGNFLEGDGSVTYYNRSSGVIDQTIFDKVNDIPLGDVFQSAFVHNGLTYLIVNNSNKVEVVDSYTFESRFSITDLQLPRYMTVYNSIGYLTEWVSFTEAGRVSIIDLATGEIGDRITVGFGAEDVEILSNKAYVTNNFEGTMSVINLEDQSVQTISLSDGPGQIVTDKNGAIWVACAGGFAANNGAIHKINTSNNTVSASFELNVNILSRLVIDNSGSTIYFISGNSVYAHGIDDTNLSDQAIVTINTATSLYGLGLDPATDILYISDSKAFLENGTVYRYNLDGSQIDSFESGRGPNGFVFN